MTPDIFLANRPRVFVVTALSKEVSNDRQEKVRDRYGRGPLHAAQAGCDPQAGRQKGIGQRRQSDRSSC